jgi:hypothetical protein
VSTTQDENRLLAEAYSKIYEHHGEDWPSIVTEITIKELLDDLERDANARDLYKSLEAWIKDNYMEEVGMGNPTKPQDAVDLTFNR